MDAFLKDKPISLLFQPHKDRFFEIVRSLSIGFINYQDFARILVGEEENLDDSTGSEVYRNLLDGMLHELKNRALI